MISFCMAYQSIKTVRPILKPMSIGVDLGLDNYELGWRTTA